MASPDFLLLARTAIDEALELTSGEKEQLLKLNKLQCKYIAQKLSWTREILQSVVEPAAAAGSDVHAFERFETALKKELYRVVTDALSLIKQCCVGQWLRAAIRYRSDKSLEYFAEICYEVQWCTSLFCRFSLQNVACSRSQDAILAPEDCDGRLDAFDLFNLETAAKQDREDLRSNLELLRHDHVCDDSCARSEAEECLAARFLKTTVPRPTAVAVVPAATTKDFSSLLWRVSPEDLPIVRLLGKGGFGEVCETKWLGERYAKKVFRDTSFQTFKTEVAILAGLFHPNVVRIICWSKERRTDYSLVMHLMQEDLSYFLRTPPTDSDPDDDVSSSSPNSAAVVVPLSMPVAVDLMLQVARGLKYLHRNNVVHRDVKSLNILVKPLTGVPELEYEEGYLSAKLADFGTSKTKNESTRRSHLTLDIGTTPWMAPEMFGIGRSTVQWPQIAHPFKTDVYSFALVCYEILTRKQPFEEVLRSELCNWITVRRVRPELPETCPRRLASLIQRCWEHDPCDRPNFPEICTELRYIKGLLLTGGTFSKQMAPSIPVTRLYPTDAKDDDQATFSKQMAPSIPVTRLYPSDAKDDCEATFDIIFFHGLKIDAGTGYEKTWRNTADILWPQRWLPQDLENIRVFSVSYDAEATKWFAPDNEEDVEYIGNNLLQNIVMGRDCIGSRPFALVGHSFGGLVIKALINETRRSSGRAERNALDGRAISKAKEFLKYLKLVVFYAVPHSEADAETFTGYVKHFSGRAASWLPQNMEPFSRRMAKMSVMMEDAFYNKKINIYAFVEGRTTYHSKMVVEPASAMRLAGNNFYKLEDCNHTQVCKPVNKQHPSYSILVDILETSREGTEPQEVLRERHAQAAVVRMHR